MIRAVRYFLSTLVVVSILGTGLSFGQEVKDGLEWHTDLNKAYDLSKQTHKPIFGFFTGSDWCGWCHRLESNVLSKPGFAKWAKANVILLELDFPRFKKQPENLVQQNQSLQQAFNVRGYPTVWIFNLDKDANTGKYNIDALGTLGYPQCEPGKEEVSFLDNANQILKSH